MQEEYNRHIAITLVMILCVRQQFAITVKSNRGWIPGREPTPYIMSWVGI